MSENFEEFANPTRHNLKEIVSEMIQPNQALRPIRQEFKQSINAYFAEQPPFPTRGENINADISKYVKLVSYCLEAGDTEILRTWGIEEVRKNPRQMLVSHDIGEYGSICQIAREESQTSLEEDCWTILIEFFLSLSPNQLTLDKTYERR